MAKSTMGTKLPRTKLPGKLEWIECFKGMHY